MRNLPLGIVLVGLLCGATLAGAGCGPSGQESVAPSEPAENTAATAPSPSPGAKPTLVKATRAASPAKPSKKARRGKHERPIPAFGGLTLKDRRLSTGDLIGKRYVLFVFNPEVDVAKPAAEGLAAVAKLRGRHNFEILGVATGSRRAVAKEFAAEHGLEFPILDDSTARISSMLRSPVPVLLASVDGEGYVTLTIGWPEKSEVGADAVEASVRKMLRLPAAPTPTHPVLGVKPLAPEVKGVDLDGQAFQLSAQRGRATLLIFFLHTCPHCHHALRFLKTALAQIPEAQRPDLVGISVVDRAYAVRERMKADGLDFFPVLMDPDDAMKNAYGANAGVPDLVLVGADGRIVHRSGGWSDDRDPALWSMWLAKAGGAPVPMLLHKTGYSGNEVCSVCHEAAAQTYALTKHAYAFGTLVKHGVERDGECIGCHSVGFEQPGGYAFDAPSSHLEGVGCESCHGRGGPHLSPDAPKPAYEERCLTCHDSKHSLGFDYATFRPKISHTGNADILSLSLDQRLARIESLGAPRKAVMPSDASYVGSDACQSCHPAEFETWAAGGHAKAGGTLEAKGEAGNAECQACHTTGPGRDGGFPKGAALADHADLGRVGCESCHGPGADHIATDARRIGTILSLGDKCDSCVILQICGGCHDDANDPGFEFEVLDKIEVQRHGTIEPGTGEMKDVSASLPVSASHAAMHLPDTVVLGLLEHALAAEPSS